MRLSSRSPAPAPVAPYRAVETARQAEAYDEAVHYQDGAQGHDPSRYDDALYGQLEAGEQDLQRDPAYPDDPYAYEAYEDEPEPKRRSSGLMTVAAVVALAVVGTGGALAYRNYVGSPRTGEPPIIKADNSADQGDPGAGRYAGQDARPHGGGRRHREDRVARGNSGRRQLQGGRTARRVSAAECQCQSALGGQRADRAARAGAGHRQRHAAAERAAQDPHPRGQGRHA